MVLPGAPLLEEDSKQQQLPLLALHRRDLAFIISGAIEVTDGEA